MASTKNETKKTADGQAGADNTIAAFAEQAVAGNVASGGIAKKAGVSQKKQEPIYTAEEFCSSAQALFHIRPECVRAAFKEKRVTQCSKAEAKQIVEDFMNKEVK